MKKTNTITPNLVKQVRETFSHIIFFYNRRNTFQTVPHSRFLPPRVGDREKLTDGGGSTRVLQISRTWTGEAVAMSWLGANASLGGTSCLILVLNSQSRLRARPQSQKRGIMNCTESSSEDDASSSDTCSMHSLSEVSTPLSSLPLLSSGCDSKKKHLTSSVMSVERTVHVSATIVYFRSTFTTIFQSLFCRSSRWCSICHSQGFRHSDWINTMLVSPICMLNRLLFNPLLLGPILFSGAGTCIAFAFACTPYLSCLLVSSFCSW